LIKEDALVVNTSLCLDFLYHRDRSAVKKIMGCDDSEGGRLKQQAEADQEVGVIAGADLGVDTEIFSI
jgi:hypothetical protein